MRGFVLSYGVMICAERRRAPGQSFRHELKIGDPDFVAALHEKSEFALCEIAARLGPGVERLPLAAIHHPMYQPLRRRLDLQRVEFIFIAETVFVLAAFERL